VELGWSGFAYAKRVQGVSKACAQVGVGVRTTGRAALPTSGRTPGAEVGPPTDQRSTSLKVIWMVSLLHKLADRRPQVVTPFRWDSGRPSPHNGQSGCGSGAR
jgi:hypothetical protein